MNASGKYDLYFAGPSVGVDLTGEIVDIGVEYGIIKKGGAWYTIGEDKFQGRDKVVEHIRADGALQERLYGELLAKSV